MVQFPDDIAEKQLLILDLGGVILDIDYGLTINAFKDLGIEDFDDLYSQSAQSGLFDRIETGVISSDEFHDGLRDIAKRSFTDEDIDQAWNAMLLGIPEHRVALLEELVQKQRMILFSNTNEIHLERFRQIIMDQYGEDILERIFDHCYYSHIFGHRKPDTETFELLLEKEGVLAEDAYFVDDSAQHVEGARAVGIGAHWLNTSQQKLEDLFKFKQEA